MQVLTFRIIIAYILLYNAQKKNKQIKGSAG